MAKENIDISMPGRIRERGAKHPLTLVLDEVKDIFTGMGFSIVEGPEVELDHYNFEMMNIPKNHPARDVQDTFYINDDVVLRTHTSPMQARHMEKNKPPSVVVALVPA
jgi:phenylalanyl-tRNA synthetase alpha chain